MRDVHGFARVLRLKFLLALGKLVILNPLECRLMVATIKMLLHLVPNSLGRGAGSLARDRA